MQFRMCKPVRAVIVLVRNCTQRRIYTTYIYKIYYISRETREYTYLCILNILIYIYIYTLNARVYCVDIKSRFCKIGYRMLLRQMCRVLLFLLSSLMLGYPMIPVWLSKFLYLGKYDEW